MGAKDKVASNPAASTAATISVVMAVVIYVAARLGLPMPSWLAVLIGGGVVSAAFGFAPAGGLTGIWRFILYGRSDGPDRKEQRWESS